MSADLEKLLAEIRGAVARGWCAEVNAKNAELPEATRDMLKVNFSPLKEGACAERRKAHG